MKLQILDFSYYNKIANHLADKIVKEDYYISKAFCFVLNLIYPLLLVFNIYIPHS